MKKDSFTLLILAGLVLLIILGKSVSGVSIISHDDSEIFSDCQFPIYKVWCKTNPEFDSHENTFNLSLQALTVGGPIDFVITSISLVQLLPEQKVNCWLNLSDLPDDKLYSEPLGVIVRRDEAVNMVLDCTEFKPSDVKEGVWVFETEAYELENGSLSPARRDTSRSSKPQGFVKINYRSCGEDRQEWCYRPGTPDERVTSISSLRDFLFVETNFGWYVPLAIIVLISILAAWRLGQKKEKSKKK